MGLVLPSVKNSALSCAEYEANILWSMDLGNSTGTLDCAKISPSSLTTCLSANSVITTINTNITNNATAIGEVAQDLTDAQTALQTNINALTTLVNNQNTTIANQATQIATLIAAFNALDSTVASFNSRLLSVEGRLTTLEDAIASGIIVVWSGAVVDIPVPYRICDGTNSTPDLRNRFIIGAGTTYAVNAIGGNIGHTHTLGGETGNTVLTVDQMPAHTHGITDPGHNHFVGGSGYFATGSTYEPRSPGAPGNPFVDVPYVSSDVKVTNISIQSTGSNGGHTHSFSTTTATTNNLPPYYALAYIMKV